MNRPVKSREGRSHDGLSTGGEQLERAPPEPTEAKQESLLHEEAMASGHTKQEAGDKLVPNTDSATIDPMSEIYRFTPMPLPTTSRRNNSDLAQPGAYGVVGAPNFHRFRAPRRQDSDEAETAPPPEIEGLAVANLVTEEDRDNLPTARPQQMGREREQESKKFKTKIFVGVILIVACVLIVLTVLVPNNKDESSRAPTKTPSASPSEAPTTLMDSILSLLPMETVVTITEDAESPQSEAFDWLMEEGHELRLSLSKERILQKFALATLFFATAGEAWIDHTNWLNHSVNECDWFNKPEFAGVSTWRTFLGEGFLQGFFPGDEQPAICGDDGLYQHLWLDENNLAGSLPMELYLLTNLQTMSLSNNRLQGSISSHIGQLGSMQGLFLNRMVESGQIPSEIGLLTKLKALVLLSNSHDGTLPSELWKLSELDTLLLSGNRQLQGTLATEIGNFHQMRWLGLDACDLNGTIPSEIGKATRLEWLASSLNSLTGTLPNEVTLLTKMQVLTLSINGLYGTIPAALGRLTDLFLLAFDVNRLSGTLPSELALLKDLSAKVDLSNNLLTGTIPSELGLLPSLKVMILSNNKLTGSIPSEFAQLASIGSLILANNSLSGTVPQEMSDLQQALHTLNLEGNPELSGTIPQDVCNMNGTCTSIRWLQCRGPYGLYFDCNGLLCGCGCSCLEQ